VPSVSATLRLAASSFLIVSRADKGFDDLMIDCTITGAGSGVFMSRICIILSYETRVDGLSAQAVVSWQSVLRA
jgi:hypothetical protein